MELDIFSEYSTLMHLLRKEECYDYNLSYRTAEYYINKHIFRNLTFRGTFTDISSLFNKLELHNTSSELDDLLLLCEIIIAIYRESNLTARYVPNGFKNQMITIMGNVDAILEKANYEAKVMPNDNKKMIIVSKNPATVLAAEIVEDTTIATNLFEYNHFAIKGHLEEKRKILNSIASYLEPSLKAKKLKGTAYSSLESDLGTFLNNFHIRHNNKEGASAQEYIVSLNDNQLEEWYDKIYSTAIMYILAQENLPIHKELDELKRNYTWKN